MGTSMAKESLLQLHPVNTPMLCLCVSSLLFNSVRGGVFRAGNFFTNFTLILAFGISNGCYCPIMHDPIHGAQAGLFGGVLWTIGLPLKILYTQRLMSPPVHYAIGAAVMGYNGAQWYKEVTYIEDAREGNDEEEF